MNTPVAITLIGMPGSGKSTLGQALATSLGLAFIDTDQLLAKKAGCTLQTLFDRDGLTEFRAKEAAVITSLKKQPSVIATGGSAVYSSAAMSHLRAFTTVVWLRVNLETIYDRINQGHGRGIARCPDQNLSQLSEERTPLYREAADFTVDVDNKPVPEVAREIHALIGR